MTTAVQFITSTAGTTWTAPADWDGGVLVTVECIGGGGAGFNGGAAGGGGGGAYSLKNSVTAANGCQIKVGAAAGDTWFNGTAANAASCGAKGGANGASGSGGAGGAAASGTGDTTASGGTGGAPGGGGGGNAGGAGAAGPGGAGGNGGAGGIGALGHGGGGANGGGGAGVTPVTTAGGNGGASITTGSQTGTAGGAGGNTGSGTSGTSGAGGGGTGTTGTNGGDGGAGQEWDSTHGSGGGGGGERAGGDSAHGLGALYGGGGGGRFGSAGAQGIIRIVYTVASAGIAFDAAANSGDQAAASSYSGSASWSGSNRFLAVDVSMLGPSVNVTAMTYGGAACTFIGSKSTVTSFGSVECWGIKQSDFAAPGPGANTLSVTLSGSLEFSVEWVSYTGVEQIVAIEAFNSAQATNVGAADATVSITTVTDNDWVHGAVVASDTSITANQTSRNNISGTLGSGGNEDNNAAKTPAGAVTMSYTDVGAAVTWAIAGYGIRPAGSDTLMGQVLQ